MSKSVDEITNILCSWDINCPSPHIKKGKVVKTSACKKQQADVNSPSKYSEKNLQILAERFANDPTDENFMLLEFRLRWSLRGYIMRMVGDDDVTSDVYNKTLMYIFYGISTYNHTKAKFTTWAHRVAYNTMLRYLKYNSDCSSDIVRIDSSSLLCDSSKDDGMHINPTAPKMYDDILDILVNGNVYEVYTSNRLLAEIYDASVLCMDYLPDNLKIVMKERYINKKKLIKISEDNNLPISSVKNWLIKGRKELGKVVKKNYRYLYDMYVDSDNVA